MNKEQIIYRNDFVKEIWENSQRFCKEEGTDAPQYVEVDKIFEIVEKYKDKEIERLNNIIDELEKWLKECKNMCVNYTFDDMYECEYNFYQQIAIADFIKSFILNKLKELKEGK